MTGTAQRTDFDVIIVGGGVAGLTSAILLARKKNRVLLIEKKCYPFHKVCGEYVSNEVLPFLQSIGFNPFDYGATNHSKLRISTHSGKNFYASHSMGGFALSRYTMDDALFQIAKSKGTEALTGTKVADIVFDGNCFRVETQRGERYYSKFVIGSYGKRDTLDKKLNRSFIHSHTGYIGVKYHIRLRQPIKEGLDNFEGGYCGLVKIEENKYNLGYLYRRNPTKNFKTIRDLEENILFKNPNIKKYMTQQNSYLRSRR